VGPIHCILSAPGAINQVPDGISVRRRINDMSAHARPGKQNLVATSIAAQRIRRHLPDTIEPDPKGE
jgi:hypothetical protein